MSLQLADECTTTGWVYNYRRVYNKRMSVELPDKFTTSGYKYRMRLFTLHFKKESGSYYRDF